MSIFSKSDSASDDSTDGAAVDLAAVDAERAGDAAELAEGGLVSWRDDRQASLARGENPMVLAELASGWAVIADTQFLPGYALLISRHRDAAMLSDLAREQRLQFLADLDLLAAAVEHACIEKDPAFRRVNLEILGNSDHYVHAHVFPRYEWEGPKALRPVWDYRDNHWTDELHEYKPGHEPLRAAITAELERLAAEAGSVPPQAASEQPAEPATAG